MKADLLWAGICCSYLQYYCSSLVQEPFKRKAGELKIFRDRSELMRSEASPSALMANNEGTESGVAFAKLIGKLKSTPRTGWVRRGIPLCESVADHSWRVAALSLLLEGTDLDVGKCMQLAVVHDIAECIVGDIAPDDEISKEDKQKLENSAIRTLENRLQAFCRVEEGGDFGVTLMTKLFHEYEERESPESIAVKDLDLLDMLIQADEYEDRYGVSLSDFFESVPPERICTPRLKGVAESIHTTRERLNSESALQPDVLSASDKAFVEQYCQENDVDQHLVNSILVARKTWDNS